LTAGLVFLLSIAIIRSRYRKFTTNYYVIHFRRGRVKSAGLGGAFFLLPIIDEFVVIPTTAQKVDIDAERVISRENQEVIIKGFLVWRVVDPAKTFSSIEWTKISVTLKDIAESVIRTTCANMSLIDILRERQKIVNAITSELDAIVADWGIKIETVEIREVDVVNRELLKNLQAEMFWTKWKEAGALEQTSKREVGILEKEREKLVGLKEKEKDLALAEKDIEIAQKKAEAEKVAKIIQAEAEKEARLRIATAEAEAEYIKLLKKAKGLEELNKVITDRLIAYEIAQKLPEAIEGLKDMFQNAVFIGSADKLGDALGGMVGVLYDVLRRWTETFARERRVPITVEGLNPNSSSETNPKEGKAESSDETSTGTKTTGTGAGSAFFTTRKGKAESSDETK